MYSAEKLFERYSTPGSLEQAVITGRYIKPNFAQYLERQFPQIPIAELIHNLQKKLPNGDIDVTDFRRELTEKLKEYGKPGSICLFNEMDSIHAVVFPESSGNEWQIAYKGTSTESETIAEIANAARSTREIIQNTHPEIINYYPNSNTELGFHLTLLPVIPDGVAIIREHATDYVKGMDGEYRVYMGGIRYEQWTVVDTTKGTNEVLLFMEILDSRSNDGNKYEKEFYISYYTIPELPPFPHGALNINRNRHNTGENLLHPGITHVFGHLPENLRNIQNPYLRRR